MTVAPEPGLREAGRAATTPVRIVDADVHPLPRSPEELREHLPKAWRSVTSQLLGSYSLVLYLPPAQPLRGDAVGPDGGVAGSDPEFTEFQLIEQAGVDVGVLLPLVRTFANPDYETALCQATNDWLAATWLGEYNRRGRWYGSINVPACDPQAAAREIERWGDHPRFVQVRLNAYGDAPFGDPRYDPIYEAATRHGLPVAVHFSKGAGMSLLTPVGFLSYFFEHHALYPVTYAAHLVSLVCGGAFDRFPELRFVFVEGGFGWVLPLLWRLENHWTALHGAGGRRPTDYVREHVRFTSQPLDEPEHRRDLQTMLELSDAASILLFSSDYPHWDFDDPRRVSLKFPDSARTRILRDNALELYGIPGEVPA